MLEEGICSHKHTRLPVGKEEARWNPAVISQPHLGQTGNVLHKDKNFHTVQVITDIVLISCDWLIRGLRFKENYSFGCIKQKSDFGM